MEEDTLVPLDPARSTAIPISSAVIIFNVCGLTTIAVLYRLFRLFRGRHHLESGIKIFGVLATDAVLVAVYILLTQVTVWGIFVGQGCSDAARGKKGRDLRKDTHIFTATALSLQFLSKLPLYLSFFHALGYFPPAPWLRMSVNLAPIYHIISFLAALLLEVFKVGDQIGIFVFSVSTDLILLTISATLFLNPILLTLSPPLLRILSFLFYTLGLFAFAAGIVWYIVTRPGISYDASSPLDLDVEERGLLWLTLQTAAVVIAGNCVTFKNIIGGEKEGERQAGPGVKQEVVREQIGVGVWREVKRGRGKARADRGDREAGWG